MSDKKQRGRTDKFKVLDAIKPLDYSKEPIGDAVSVSVQLTPPNWTEFSWSKIREFAAHLKETYPPGTVFTDDFAGAKKGVKKYAEQTFKENQPENIPPYEVVVGDDLQVSMLPKKDVGDKKQCGDLIRSLIGPRRHPDETDAETIRRGLRHSKMLALRWALIREVISLVPKDHPQKLELKSSLFNAEDPKVACDIAYRALSAGIDAIHIVGQLYKMIEFQQEYGAAALDLQIERTATCYGGTVVEDEMSERDYKKYLSEPVITINGHECHGVSAEEASIDFKPPPQTTHSAKLRFKDGTDKHGNAEFLDVDIPGPGEGWTKGETTVFDWPITYLDGIPEEQYTIETSFEFEEYPISHDAGRMVLDEYRKRIEAEHTQVLEVTEWTKKANEICIDTPATALDKLEVTVGGKTATATLAWSI